MNATKQPNRKQKQRNSTRSAYGGRDKHCLFLLQWEKNSGPNTNQAETMPLNFLQLQGYAQLLGYT